MRSRHAGRWIIESSKKICVIIPAFNEQDSILEVVRSLKSEHPDFTIVVINDCSTDKTENVAKSSGAEVISLTNNLGIGGAVQTGMLYAMKEKFDIAVQFDGDGQHLAHEIQKIIEPLVYGRADLVIGSRWLDGNRFESNKSRRIGSLILCRLVSWKSQIKFTDVTSGFRAFNKDSINLFSASYPKDFAEITAILSAHENRLRVVEVPVEMKKRMHGTSSIHLFASIYYMIMEIFIIIFFGKI